jgi:reactive intermediate/imine deaminase
MKQIIQTSEAPAAIGTYSQAVKVNNHVYISGQIPLNPQTMTMVENDIDAEIRQVFDNLKAILTAAGGGFSDIVKLNIYVTDLANFPRINEIMAQYFTTPYPARAVVGVSALPKGARVEADAVMVLTK